MRLNSPAKLNLFFRILFKRLDGFHEIASLFQAIDLFDVLTFSNAPFDRLTCSDSSLSCDESNLATQAIQLFRKHYECPSTFIHLEKHIPMQSGLGGGSSNAATVLWALNERSGRPATIQQLASMGAQIGSDVPFFFSTGTAYCTGRGEIFQPHPLVELSGLIVKPPFGLSTPRVYRETKIDRLKTIAPLLALQSFSTQKKLYFNDLEDSAFCIEPQLSLIKDSLLKCGFDHVSMTGSGTAFFCLGRPNREIPSNLQKISFRTVNREDFSWYS